MDATTLEAMIATFQHMQKRPGMYMSDELPAVMNYLNGFVVGLGLMEQSLRQQLEQQVATVAQQRGWQTGGAGPWHQMRLQGFADAAITTEMLTIYLEAFQSLLAAMQSENSDDVEAK